MGNRPVQPNFLLAAAILVTLLCGCASVPALPPLGADGAVPATATAAAPGERGWWYARFRIDWPLEEEPRWYLDARIAREVVAPVLKSHQDQIELWRFHRRARRDPAGHQFSFIFYAAPATADKVFHALRESPLLAKLKADHLLIEDAYDRTTEITRPGLGDTSDPQWSEPLRQAWPWFIMGVSRTWLDLVDHFARQAEASGDASGADPDACYREVERRLQELWRNEGDHAFLHHLNALFGYQPTTVYEKRLMTF